MAKRSKGGMIGSKQSPGAENLYGTPEEIAGRDGFTPRHAPTTFRQIGPEDTGGDLSHPNGPTLTSSVKFAKGAPF